MNLLLTVTVRGVRSAQMPREQERLADLVRALVRAYCNPQRIDVTVQELPA